MKKISINEDFTFVKLDEVVTEVEGVLLGIKKIPTELGVSQVAIVKTLDKDKNPVNCGVNVTASLLDIDFDKYIGKKVKFEYTGKREVKSGELKIIDFYAE